MPGDRHWKESLVKLADLDEKFTAADAAAELDLTPAAASQLVRRLARYGLIRATGFAEPVHANGRKKGSRQGIGGRRRIVYELTEAGEKKVDWIEKHGEA